MRPASLPRLALFLLTGWLIAAASAPAQAQKCCKPELHLESGLNIASFQTPGGAVRVFLPDDMAAGDTISGTVAAAPRLQPGQIPEQALGELRGYVVEIEGQKAAPGSTANFHLPTSVSQVMLVLRDKNGQELSRQAVPVLAAGQARTSCSGHDLFMSAGHDLFMLPTIGQEGQPLAICGAFDGDLGTTALTIGGQGVRALAESPRRALFEAPAMRPGAQTLELNKSGRRALGSIQLLIVSLGAPKTVLQRGESTTLTVLVSGLAGLQQSVPLEVVNRSTSVVTLEGGDSQVIPIHPMPGQDQATITRTVTGLQPGGFDIRAQVKIEAAPGSSAPAGGSKPPVSATGPGQTSAPAPANPADAGQTSTPTPGSETPVSKVATPGNSSGFCAMGSVGKPTGKPSPTPERALLCRGTIEMLLVDRPYSDPGGMGDTYLWGTFALNPTEAGDSGQKLASGTCAWADVAIAPSQPAQFLFEFTATNPKSLQRASLIEHCSSDSQCVFEVCASFYAYYPPVWWIDASKIRIVFPKF